MVAKRKTYSKNIKKYTLEVYDEKTNHQNQG